MAIVPDVPQDPDHAARTALPVRGMVIRHAFLWGHEKAAGRDEGSKDRPAVIVLVIHSDETVGTRVGVVPVTHTPPVEPEAGLEIPDGVKRQLGLDMDAQWIVFDEINRFLWPGYDLRQVPRTGADSYGMLPELLFQDVLKGILARHMARTNVIVDRG